jgi:hypothetical protein
MTKRMAKRTKRRTKRRMKGKNRIRKRTLTNRKGTTAMQNTPEAGAGGRSRLPVVVATPINQARSGLGLPNGVPVKHSHDRWKGLAPPRTPSPKRQAFAPSTTSLKDLARMGEVKDVLAEFKAMMNMFTPDTGAVAAVPSHEKYMEIIRAVTSNGQSRAPEPEVVRVHAVDSVLSTVGCFKYKQAFLAEGVVEAEDLYALASKDKLLDKIGLTEVEKDRYKRKMRDVYGA